METLLEREDRIARLEAARARRRAQRAAASRAGRSASTQRLSEEEPWPLEIAPGRGDFARGSISWPPESRRSVQMIGGRSVSFAKLFATQPYIAAAVMRQLTWSIRVPLKVYRREGEDPAARHRLRPGEHPLADAIEAQDGRSAAELEMALFGPVLVHGNSVTLVESGARESIRFEPKDWRFARPLMSFRDKIQGWRFDVDDERISLEHPAERVLHIRWWSPLGPIGTSPLQQLGITLQIEDAAQRFTRATFANGARPPSAVTASDEWLGLEKPERQQLLRQLREDLSVLYSGPENAGRPALLPPGLDWKPVASSSVEAELVRQRQINREEICSVYQIPPPMLGDLTHGTYSNVETLHSMVYTDVLGPPLVLIEQAINAQVIRRLLGETDVFVEHDFGEVLRGDRLQEIQALREGIATALYTPNEGRQVLNLQRSPDPGMDRWYLPANNLQPVGSAPTPGFMPIPVPGASQGARSLHVRSRERDYEVLLR